MRNSLSLGISRYRLAEEIGVPAQRISEIVAGKRAISADTDCGYAGSSVCPMANLLRAQAAYYTEGGGIGPGGDAGEDHALERKAAGGH